MKYVKVCSIKLYETAKSLVGDRFEFTVRKKERKKERKKNEEDENSKKER